MRRRTRERTSYMPSILRETFQSLTRNALISIAAALAIIAALVILGVFIVFTTNVNTLTSAAEDNLQVQIFLKEDVADRVKDDIYNEIIKNPSVTEVTFESKQEALENFSDSLEENAGLLSEYSAEAKNPLPESFIVKADNVDSLAEVRDTVNESFSENIEYIRYRENFISSLTRFTRFVNFFSFVLLVIMSLIALFLIYNTIRLTVVNRKREIEIMKYIGATNRFIQMPFFLEGTFLGLISALISVLLVCMAYYYLIGFLNGSVFFSFQSALVAPDQIVLALLVCFSAYGLVIGSMGALIATRRYLDV